MKELMQSLREASLKAISETDTPESVEALRVRYLGKKGELTSILRQMGKLSAEERPVMGQLANQLRAEIEQAIELRKTMLGKVMLEKKLEAEAVDVTLPGVEQPAGHKHPMYNVLDQIKDIFIGMGYEIVDGPEVELSEYNFTKLNIEESHPSRDWTDTFYFTEDGRVCLRTQTSPMQVHAMETRPLPIRMIAPGRVYRKDEVDATHSPMFHQIEGMVIDKGITMADLKATLNLVVEHLRQGHGHPLPPAPLPLHRAELRAGHPVPQVRRQGLPDLQGRGLDRGPRRRHGAPQGARRLRHRPGRLLRLGLRHGSGAPRDGRVQDHGSASDLRERRQIPRAVLRRADRWIYPENGSMSSWTFRSRRSTTTASPRP